MGSSAAWAMGNFMTFAEYLERRGAYLRPFDPAHAGDRATFFEVLDYPRVPDDSDRVSLRPILRGGPQGGDPARPISPISSRLLATPDRKRLKAGKVQECVGVVGPKRVVSIETIVGEDVGQEFGHLDRGGSLCGPVRLARDSTPGTPGGSGFSVVSRAQRANGLVGKTRSIIRSWKSARERSCSSADSDRNDAAFR
jgi:hypothetical protein